MIQTRQPKQENRSLKNSSYWDIKCELLEFSQNLQNGKRKIKKKELTQNVWNWIFPSYQKIIRICSYPQERKLLLSKWRKRRREDIKSIHFAKIVVSLVWTYFNQQKKKHQMWLELCFFLPLNLLPDNTSRRSRYMLWIEGPKYTLVLFPRLRINSNFRNSGVKDF